MPVVISPTKIPFSKLGPNAVELKNSISVTPLDSAQLKTGSAYFDQVYLLNLIQIPLC